MIIIKNNSILEKHTIYPTMCTVVQVIRRNFILIYANQENRVPGTKLLAQIVRDTMKNTPIQQ